MRTRLTIAAIVLIFLIVAFSMSAKWLKNGATNWLNKDSVRDAKSSIDAHELSYDSAWYSSNANALFTNLNGASLSNSPSVSIIKKCKTASDWYKLFAEFGVREGDQGYGLYPITKFRGDLRAWLADDLSTSELDELDTYLQQIGVIL